MDLLARREHTRLELERKLADRDFDSTVIGDILDRLQEDGLLDEDRFIESFIRTRIGKGHGPARIEAELRRRGIDNGKARRCLHDAELNWHSLAAGVREKRFGPGRPENFKERARQMRYLHYRGFDSEHISAALEVAGNSD